MKVEIFDFQNLCVFRSYRLTKRVARFMSNGQTANQQV
jgi:hypothetical protein